MATTADVMAAVEQGDGNRLKALLATNPTVAAARDAVGVSAILGAHYRGRADLVAILLGASPELDVFEAAALGRTDEVVTILDADADAITARSGDGFTPLHLAAFFGHTETAAALLARGADVAAVSVNPMAVTALNSAAALGHDGVVALLLEAGAPVDAAQQGGYTALHSAAKRGDLSVVERLLAAGASPAAESDRGTPADLARSAGHVAVVERLNQPQGAT